MPTLDCWVQLLRPGQRTEAHRHTSSAVYFVVRGEGTTVVDDVELDWGPHDSFVVPNWSTHHFVNRSTEDAVAVLGQRHPYIEGSRSLLRRARAVFGDAAISAGPR
ncbi:cupin domain-containing protein [Mycolicibacterium sp. D3]